MAESSGAGLVRDCESAMKSSDHEIIMAVHATKIGGDFGGSFENEMSKSRVLAISKKTQGEQTLNFVVVFKYLSPGVLKPSKLYNLKDLSKVEVESSESTGCTILLDFDNAESQIVSLPRWTMQNIVDRDHLLRCVFDIYNNDFGHLPEIIWIDEAEMVPSANVQDGPVTAAAAESDMTMIDDRELMALIKNVSNLYQRGGERVFEAEREFHMGESRADDAEFQRVCQVAEGTGHEIIMAVRVTKIKGILGELLETDMPRQRVLGISREQTGNFVLVFKYTTRGVLKVAKFYNLEDLSKVEVVSNDSSGCTIFLGFGDLESQSVSLPQWTMKNVDDRNRFLLCVLHICEEKLGRLPEVTGIDKEEMVLSANPENLQDGRVTAAVAESDMTGLSQIEEKDMEALIRTYGMGIGEAETLFEWLKRKPSTLKVATLHFILESKPLIGEYAERLTDASFDEASMPYSLEACEWLKNALGGLEASKLVRLYASMRPVREKQEELEKLRNTFVTKASEFLRDYFDRMVGVMMSDMRFFSRFEALKTPDHTDLQNNFQKYAFLLQNLKNLDKNCLGPVRKAYCSSLNLLLRSEARALVRHLFPRKKEEWQICKYYSTVPRGYATMLNILIPLFLNESDFFARFMCFEVPALVPPGSYDNDEAGERSSDLKAFNVSIRDLFDGVQEDFHYVMDQAYKIDPLHCISLHGITKDCISRQKADAAECVRRLLDDLEKKTQKQFSGFVSEACNEIESAPHQVGKQSYITRFASIASRMEQLIHSESRDLVNEATTKLVGPMFVTLEKIAQANPEYADIFLLKNYAAIQKSLCDLAKVAPVADSFYHQAGERFEQACKSFISTIIDSQFKELFLFSQRIEDMFRFMTPGAIRSKPGLSTNDLQLVVTSNLSELTKSIGLMYEKMQKDLNSEELLPSLWYKFKEEFLQKYEGFAKVVGEVYPTVTVTPVPSLQFIGSSLEM